MILTWAWVIGLGYLSWAVQALKRELLFQHGWDWFNYIAIQTLEQDEDEIFTSVELTLETPMGDRH